MAKPRDNRAVCGPITTNNLYNIGNQTFAKIVYVSAINFSKDITQYEQGCVTFLTKTEILNKS